MLKKITIILCLLSCNYYTIGQNNHLFDLVYFVLNPPDSTIPFLKTTCCTVCDVGEFYGTEDNYLNVSINKNSSYYIKGELLGASIDSTPYLFVKYQFCCATGVTLYQCYYIDTLKDTLLLIEQMSVSDAIKIPSVQNFETLHFVYNNKTKRRLRASPLIDDTIWNYDLRQKGNVCGTIVSGAEGYILSSALNEAGDKFYLIALKNNKASSVFSSDFDGNDTFFLCWIKADDM